MTHSNPSPAHHPDSEKGLLLPGLDGSNPLGFLAAIGVLRVLSIQCDKASIRMAWKPYGGSWIPMLLDCGNEMDDVVNQLQLGLDSSEKFPWTLDNKLPFEAGRLRDAALEAVFVASVHKRERADLLASFGVESIRNDNGTFKDTALRMIRSGDSVGNGLLAYSRRIHDETTIDDLRTALTETWTYEDERCALRWDPKENHGYALQWTNPSKESTVSVRGANHLALASMPLLPTIPLGTNVATTSFGYPNGQAESLTWPIWTSPSCSQVVQSLLTLSEIQDKKPHANDLALRGIAAIYRCDRIMTSTYYRNFTPAQRVA